MSQAICPKCGALTNQSPWGPFFFWVSAGFKMEELKRIEKYARDIAKNCDKLRQAIEVIEDIFGLNTECQRCGFDIEVHERVDDEILSEKAREIVRQCISQGGFVPKIQVNINIVDDKPFYKDGDKQLHLAFNDCHLKVASISVDKPDKYYELSSLSNEELKELIRSKRLIAFFKNVAKKFKKMNQKYREVSEIAEKIAQAIKP